MRKYKAPFEKEFTFIHDGICCIDIDSSNLFAINNKDKIISLNNLNSCKCIVVLTKWGIEYYIFDDNVVFIYLLKKKKRYCEIRIGAKRGLNIYHGSIYYQNINAIYSNGELTTLLNLIIEICKSGMLLL